MSERDDDELREIYRDFLNSPVYHELKDEIERRIREHETGLIEGTGESDDPVKAMIAIKSKRARIEELTWLINLIDERKRGG